MELPEELRSQDGRRQRTSELRSALQTCRGAFVGIAVFSFASNLLMLAGPLYMLQIYDRVLASHSIPTLMALTIFLIVAYTCLGVFEFIRSRVLSQIGVKIEAKLGARVFDVWVTQGLLGR